MFMSHRSEISSIHHHQPFRLFADYIGNSTLLEKAGMVLKGRLRAIRPHYSSVSEELYKKGKVIAVSTVSH